MHSNAFLLYFFAVFALCDAAYIPFRRVNIPSASSQTVNERRDGSIPNLIGEQFNIPAVVMRTVTLAVPSSVPLVSPLLEPSGFVMTLKSHPIPTSISSPSSSASTSLVTFVVSSTTSVFPTSSIASPTSTSSTFSTTLAASTSTSQQPQPTATDGPRKFVVAHHMVGNTFPYTKQDWAEDITLAHASGIDGFALNVGRDQWEPARIADAYQAAMESKLDFQLFLSLDMTSLPCNSAGDAEYLRKLVLAHASHPNQFKYDGRAFVSSFAGQTCQFGQGNVADAWKTQFAKHPDLQGKIYFVPSFFIDPAKFVDFAQVIDGDFNWNSGWPIQVRTAFAKDLFSKLLERTKAASPKVGLLKPLITIDSTAASSTSGRNCDELQLALSKFIGSTDTDTEHLDALKALRGELGKRNGEGEGTKPVYMGAVSPWFFTHYGVDSFNKNFMYLSDQHLYSKRWESLVDSRDQFDIVQILTWNDYGESHYIGPIKGAQPNSEAWTDGMDHTAWLDLTRYYATAFKTGQYPKIEQDKIFMWSRPHSATAKASDPIPQPDNFELTEDAVWAVVMTTAPSTVTLSTSPTSKTSFDVPAGLSKLAVPITPGGTMKGTIERDGKVIVELSPSPEAFTFQGSPKSYNFNAFVASATAQ